VSVCGGGNDNLVLAVRVDEDQCQARRRRTLQLERDSCVAHRRQSLVRERIVADCADEANVRTEPRGGDCLIRALATGNRPRS